MLGVAILSPDAILIRLLHADTFTIMLWRGISFCIGVTLLMLVFYRKKTVQQLINIGRPGLLIGLIFALSTVFFTIAIQNTSISNTLVIISTSPMFAALFSWIFLKEKIKVITWIAMLIIIAAIAMIMSDSSSSGSGLMGDICAFCTSILAAISLTVTRRYKAINMVPAMAISGLISAFIAVPLIISSGSPLFLASSSVPYLIAGAFCVSIAFALITLGPRYIPAPEVGLILPLETVLGSYFAWIILNEEPTALTLIGGIIVIVTLIIHGWFSLQKMKSND